MSDPVQQDGRTINLPGATLIGISAIVGGGIFVLGGAALETSGAGAPFAYLLNGLLAAVTALSFAEMATAFPISGGGYAYARKIFSVRAAFGVGWILWFAHVVASVLYAAGFASYARTTLIDGLGVTLPGWMDGRALTVTVASIAAMVFTGIYLRRRGGGGRVMNVIKLMVFVGLIGWGVAVWLGDSGTAHASGSWTGTGFAGIVTTMGITFITLQGFDLIGAMGGEIRTPSRNIPLAMLISLGCALAVYIPLLLVIIVAGVPGNMSVSEWASRSPETAIPDAIRNFAGPVGYWAVLGAALLATLSALGANLLAAAHIAHAMATDRTLPRPLAQRHPKFGTPRVALVVGWVGTLILLLIVPDLAAAGSAASLVFLVSFALGHMMLIVARRRGAGGEDTFRIPFFPVLPIAGGLACLGLAIFQGVTVPIAGAIVAGWLALGMIVYVNVLAPRAESLDAFSESVDPELMRLRGRSPSVLIPVSNPASVATLAAVGQSVAAARGKVVFLSVLNRDGGRTEDRLAAIAHVVRGLGASTSVRSPEMLVTLSDLPWNEIRRVAREQRCETLILGLSRMEEQIGSPEVERLIDDLDCSVILCSAPEDWVPSQAERVLVPIEGSAAHDRVRGRLLGALVRGGTKTIDFLTVVRPGNASRRKEAEHTLRNRAQDEGSGRAEIRVVESDSPGDAIVDAAEGADLMIMGLSQQGRSFVLGPVVQDIVRRAGCPMVLIARR